MDQRLASIDQRTSRALLAGLSVIAVVGIAGFLRVNGPHIPGVSCPSRALTGLDCPGCGSTRSVAALLKGDLATAVDQNLLAVMAIPLLVWAWIAWLAGVWTGKRYETPLHRTGAAVATLVLVIGFTLTRNIDLGVGSFLASGTS